MNIGSILRPLTRWWNHLVIKSLGRFVVRDNGCPGFRAFYVIYDLWRGNNSFGIDTPQEIIIQMSSVNQYFPEIAEVLTLDNGTKWKVIQIKKIEHPYLGRTGVNLICQCCDHRPDEVKPAYTAIYHEDKFQEAVETKQPDPVVAEHAVKDYWARTWTTASGHTMALTDHEVEHLPWGRTGEA